MSNSYVLSLRADFDRKEVAITARDPEKAGCQVINKNGHMVLRWNWLVAKNRPDLNDWDILFNDLSREEARARKQDLIELYLKDGFKIRTVKNYEVQ